MIYDERPTDALQKYSEAIIHFRELGDDLERAKCLINRGVAKWLLHDLESGLHDTEMAIEIIGTNSSHYFVVGTINSAAILTRLGEQTKARDKVEEAQDLLSGIRNVERPKLVLRWIKSLLLEYSGEKNDRKLASQMISRVEVRMRALDMQRERRVLLADQARIAQAPHVIRKIARRALDMEDSPRVRTLIQAVIDDTTQENILQWRNSLDSYVPPFVDVA